MIEICYHRRNDPMSKKILVLTGSARTNGNSNRMAHAFAEAAAAKGHDVKLIDTAKLKLKHIDLELQLNNLFDQRQYTRVNYSGLDIYTNTSQLRPRNIIGTIRFKLL